MPPTREQRDAFALCGAKTKTGSPCRMFAGQGTDHVGVGRCFRHGGCSPTHNKAAVAQVVEQRLHQEAEPLSDEEAQPHSVLKSLLAETGGRVRWLDAELGRQHSAKAEQMYRQERQFLAWISKLCSEVKLEDWEVSVRQSQAAQMAAMVKEALERVGVDSKVVEAVGVGPRARVLEASGETAAADAEAAKLDQLREEIAAADRERIADAARKEAERLSGLTLPPAEWVAPEPERPAA
jgi:hypothetical protein